MEYADERAYNVHSLPVRKWPKNLDRKSEVDMRPELHFVRFPLRRLYSKKPTFGCAVVGLTVAVVAVADMVCADDSTPVTPVSVRITQDTIEPQSVILKHGETVVWVNGTGKAARVKILSEPVSTTCNEPVGFVETSRGIHRSNAFNDGGVLSLCLIEPRQYQYEVDVFEDQPAVKNKNRAVLRTMRGSLRVD